MKFKLIQVPAFLLALLLSSLAFAADAATAAVVQQEWWQGLLAWLGPIFGGVLTAVLAALGVQLLRKWNIEMKPATLEDVIGKAVNYAEGRALAALNAGGPKTPGAEKMALATGVADLLLKQFKLEALAKESLVALIEAKLGEQKTEEKKALMKMVVTDGNGSASPIKLPKWAQDIE